MRLAFLVSMLVFVCQLPMVAETANPNTATRFMLVAAIVERGTTNIDVGTEFTVDKSQQGDHYYSDKAPGIALLGVPIYAVLQAVDPGLKLLAEDGSMARNAKGRVAAHLVALGTSGLLIVLAAGAMVLVAQQLGAPSWVAALAGTTFVLATPIWGWSTYFFGHAAAAGCLFLCFTCLLNLSERPEGLWLAAGAGLFGALAVSIEYPVALGVLILILFGLWRIRSFPGASQGKLLGMAVLAGLISFAPTLIYHTVTFGGPFSVGYSKVVGFEGMEQGLLGITFPKPDVLWQILASPYRGILLISPMLLLMAPGVLLGWRNRDARGVIVACVGVVLTFVLYNASYFYWDGGFSFGPRHITPALAFAVLPTIWFWSNAGQVGRWVGGLLAAASVLICFTAAATQMTPDDQFKAPLVDVLIPALFAGDNKFVKLGEMGVSAYLLFALWLLVMAIAAALVVREVRQQAAEA